MQDNLSYHKTLSFGAEPSLPLDPQHSPKSGVLVLIRWYASVPCWHRQSQSPELVCTYMYICIYVYIHINVCRGVVGSLILSDVRAASPVTVCVCGRVFVHRLPLLYSVPCLSACTTRGKAVNGHATCVHCHAEFRGFTNPDERNI